jgi:hypothetical protein
LLTCPYWFHEGLAMLLAGERLEDQPQQPAASLTNLDFAALEKDLQHPRDQAAARAAYARALALVTHLSLAFGGAEGLASGLPASCHTPSLPPRHE